MSPLIQSYVYGASTEPLIGDTIGVHFDKSATRWTPRQVCLALFLGDAQ